MFRNQRLSSASLEANKECSEEMSAISLLLETGEDSQAREKLGRFAERFQEDPMAHAFASVCYSQLGDISDAMAENAIAMALHPTDPARYERMAELLRQKGYTEAANRINGKTLVFLEEKWVKRINSPLYFVVAALTGVSVSFAPLFLYWAGGEAGGNYFSFAHILNPWVLLCFATIYFVPGFYMSLASSVIAQVYKPGKVRKQ